jgi:hypothetical protein
MRGLLSIAAVVMTFAGIVFGVMAFMTGDLMAFPANTSALQATQVYSSASYHALMAIMCFAFAILCSLNTRHVAVEPDEDQNTRAHRPEMTHTPPSGSKLPQFPPPGDEKPKR